MYHSTLLAPIFSDPTLTEQFSDDSFIHHMLTVEAALATAQAKLDIIPAEAAQAVVQAIPSLRIDMTRLQEGMDKAGVPVIELVRQLRQYVGETVGEEIASYVHWGATTQDIMDTALILQMRVALTHIDDQLTRLINNLARMADHHRGTLMAGRTHSQQALPISFGLKVAGWLAPLLRHRQRLGELKPRLLCVQLGGAVGTLSVLGERGIEVQRALADELGLGVPVMPWHTQRDSLAEVAGWLSLVTGSLAKMAQDIILMAQSEVGEINESADPTRGGSSTMPQKSNPILSEAIIAAARTNASLLASMHQAMIQEHERATHGWQMEWLSLPQMFILTGGALQKARFLSENLVVDVAQMRKNIAASQGLMLAEAVSFALTPHVGRSQAQQIVKQACRVAIAEGRHLVEVVQAQTKLPIDWQTITEENYLGSANQLIDAVLSEVEKTDVQTHLSGVRTIDAQQLSS